MSESESRIDSFILEEVFAPHCKSIRNVEEVHVLFINNSYDTVDLFWIDFRGCLVRYLKLGAREAVKVTTFVGHCWTARFVRNGATAQFLPDRSEVLVIAGPYPYTAFAFIIQKVPTLLEAAVEYIGEIFHNDQCALRKLPVPELVKLDIYFYIRRKQIYQRALYFLPLLYPNQRTDGRLLAPRVSDSE